MDKRIKIFSVFSVLEIIADPNKNAAPRNNAIKNHMSFLRFEIIKIPDAILTK